MLLPVSSGIETLLRVASVTPELRQRLVRERADLAPDLDVVLSDAEVAVLSWKSWRRTRVVPSPLDAGTTSPPAPPGASGQTFRRRESGRFRAWTPMMSKRPMPQPHHTLHLVDIRPSERSSVGEGGGVRGLGGVSVAVLLG